MDEVEKKSKNKIETLKIVYKFSLSSIKLIYSKMLSRSLRTEINKKEEELIVLLIKLLYMNKEYSKVCDVSEKYESKIDFQKKRCSI